MNRPETLTIEERLGATKFVVDEDEAHIVLDPGACERDPVKPCLVACPARCFQLKDGKVSFDYVGCLECGTCLTVCHSKEIGGGISWSYPRGGFGLQYRYG